MFAVDKWTRFVLIHIVLDHIIILLILTMAGFMDSIDSGLFFCDSYHLLPPTHATTDEVMLPIVSSCGCSLHDPQPCPLPFAPFALCTLCRDLDVVPIPNFPDYRLTCKKTATPACKSSVEIWTKVWKKVPNKCLKNSTFCNDFCYEFYKETQIWASSCN